MDYSKEEDGINFYLRFLQALMVSEDVSEFLKEAEELQIDYTCIPLLEMTNDVLDHFLEGWALPFSIHNNLLGFISASRFASLEESPEDKAKRFSICNEIVYKLNQSCGKEEYPFYPNLIDRFFPKPIQKWWNHFLYDGNATYMQGILDAYLQLQYYVLYSHTEIVNDDEFLQFWCNFLVNTTYLETIDLLLNELPELTSDPIFMKRLRNILLENEKLFKEYKGKKDPTGLAELEPEDIEIIRDRHFWKMQRKIKSRIKKFQKDS